jgi:predicted DNA-binding protein (MmcQ/YjbR family)
MTRDQFDSYCGSLKATTHVVQWGNASVWKVGGKIFAICSTWGAGEGQKIGFKCSDMSYALLCEQDGIVPAPYLARAKWVQLEAPEAMGDTDIELYIQQAHRIIAGKLTKAKRAELGL